MTHGVPLTDAPPAPLLAIAMDGKPLRGSANAPEATPAVRLLSAFVHDLGATLAQQPIAATTNEVGTLPELLRDLVLDGTVVTTSATARTHASPFLGGQYPRDSRRSAPMHR